MVTTAATVATVTEASPCDTNKVERHKRDKMEKNLILILSENIVSRTVKWKRNVKMLPFKK